MHIERSSSERGTGTVEWLGIIAAIVVVMGAIGTRLGHDGRPLGSVVAERLTRLVQSEAEPNATHAVHRARFAQEQRWGSGTPGARVARNDLHMSPVMPPASWWRRELGQQGTVQGVRWSAGGTACALCAGLDERHTLTAGATADAGGSASGIALDVATNVHVALAAVAAQVSGSRAFGPLRVSATGRARALIGGDAQLETQLQAGPDSQHFGLRAGAMAGAVGRAEGRLGVSLLGVAVEQSGAAEGWAGAGARGVVDAGYADHKLTWQVGWGAALGLGGAASWSGSIDTSHMPERHRRIAREVLSTALTAHAGPATLGVVQLIRHN